MSKVVVLGSVNLDLHLQVERHPRGGETLLAGDLERRFGGKGGNQAVASAGAGAPTSLVGAVGDDEPGREYRRRLEAFGVDVAALREASGVATGTAVICVDARGENTIVVAPGANHRVTRDDLAALDGLAPGDVLLAQLELPLDVVAEGVRRAVARGARVVLNLAPFAQLPADVLALADPVVVNEHEAELLHEQLGDDDAAPPSLLVTLGAAGSRWGELEVPGQPVAHVVDTTGAGDSFCGVLAARLAAGDDRRAAVEAATAAAALTVQHDGAQPPAPRG
ncbi:ribokinase [Quadrisphaera granulorum]|uniref:Ribokinase n=1 Tax=Quadrisphaera granulorum TaxID=317664 RepID=A0A316ARK4_9ACTN|nr:ribokinase [Quadrisphaera granulorum]PWJ52727.1 ribokinase [Quadrisphaera granulorum]SZE97549.1 ribokinase [Quadrisphaera granulorum]